MFSKTLRLHHFGKVSDFVDRFFEILSSYFYMHRLLMSNLNGWIRQGVMFVLSVHYFACGFLLIISIKKMQGIDKVVDFQPAADTFFEQYFSAWYLTTTTITTIGYGDYKGFVDVGGDWTAEMLYFSCVLIGGIIMFSSVRTQIFLYRHTLTVQEIVVEKSRAMEVFLYDVSRRRKDKVMDRGLIHNSIVSIQNQVKGSTIIYFEKNQFYSELPQSLQYRLVRSVLHRQYKTFNYFFNDFEEGFRASEALMMTLLT